MLAHNLKDVMVLVDKDRVKSGRLAIDKWQVDTFCSTTDCSISISSIGSTSCSSIDKRLLVTNSCCRAGTLRERRATAPGQLYFHHQKYRRIQHRVDRSNPTSQSHRGNHRVRAQAALPAKHRHRPTIAAGNIEGRVHRVDFRNCRAGKFRRRDCATSAPNSNWPSISSITIALPTRDEAVHESLHSTRSGDDRHHGKRRSANARLTEMAGADLFFTGGNRNLERTRKLGTLCGPHLQTPAAALAGAVFA